MINKCGGGENPICGDVWAAMINGMAWHAENVLALWHGHVSVPFLHVAAALVCVADIKLFISMSLPGSLQ